MKSGKLARKLIRDTVGSVLVEAALVMPMFLVLILGIIDAAYMIYDWEDASEATYIGARAAVVSDPVAAGITSANFSATELQNIGLSCFDTTTGVVNNCPTFSATCDSGACTNGYTYNATAFNTILAAMRAVDPRINSGNVEITYSSNGTGFVGEPASSGGLPMDVTVSLRCMTHEFFFINGLMGWAFSPPAACPKDLKGPSIPSFATTLQSEDMATN